MKQSVVLFVCCSLVMASIGCSQNMGTVRGQAPGQYQPDPYQMAANGGGDMRIAGPQPGVQYYDGPAYDPNQFSSADCPTCPQGNGCQEGKPVAQRIGLERQPYNQDVIRHHGPPAGASGSIRRRIAPQLITLP